MQNSMLMFIFFVFDWNYPFWANLVKKVKLSIKAEIWYLDQFECAEFNGGVHSFYSFYTGNTLFGQTWSKKSKLSV